MGAENPREIAVRVLLRRNSAGEYVERLLENELARHSFSSQDRALCQELVYGMVRWQAALDWLAGRKTGERPQKPAIRLLIHLGLYQLFWLQRIPDHAAVNSTVELAQRLGFAANAGFINAILRGYTRERAATEALLRELKRHDPATGYSHLRWLVERWQERWGLERTAQLLEWNNTPAKVFARRNALNVDADRLIAGWREEGVDFEEKQFEWTPPRTVFELKSPPPLARLKSFQDGFFYVQDPSTLLAVRELNPQPGETILDVGAAPGGKTTFIAQIMLNQGRIVARDIQPERLKMLEENCQRLGISCVELSGPESPQEFDRVLVDAPCSNTGVLRRRVDLRWRIKREEIERLQATQSALLAESARGVRPGGVLVYSTCSLEPEENEGVVNAFLREHTAFSLDQQRQLLPMSEGVDGAFVARFRKTG